MTAQFSEHLIYQGKELTLCSEPLGPFLQFSGSTVKFDARCTALWRGYVGTWSIENDRLYLVKLCAYVDDAVNCEVLEFGLEILFPDYPDGVFAHWFTGELRCPSGALLNYVHGGFGSTYERDLFFRVQRGVVLEERTVVNGQAEPDATQDYLLAGMTTFGQSHND
jgi:hypothetical protein